MAWRLPQPKRTFDPQRFELDWFWQRQEFRPSSRVVCHWYQSTQWVSYCQCRRPSLSSRGSVLPLQLHLWSHRTIRAYQLEFHRESVTYHPAFKQLCSTSRRCRPIAHQCTTGFSPPYFWRTCSESRGQLWSCQLPTCLFSIKPQFAYCPSWEV